MHLSNKLRKGAVVAIAIATMMATPFTAQAQFENTKSWTSPNGCKIGMANSWNSTAHTANAYTLKVTTSCYSVRASVTFIDPQTGNWSTRSATSTSSQATVQALTWTKPLYSGHGVSKYSNYGYYGTSFAYA